MLRDHRSFPGHQLVLQVSTQAGPGLWRKPHHLCCLSLSFLPRHGFSQAPSPRLAVRLFSQHLTNSWF